eukprot:749930-Pyramimonas_sp.AAC.1
MRATGARVLAIDMCEWGLAPPDEPHLRYQKRTWWLASLGLYPYALILARRCAGHQTHRTLEGGLPYDLTDAQVEAYNLDTRIRLSKAEASELINLSAKLSATGESYGLGNDGVTVTLPPDDKLIRVNQLIA